MKKVRKPVGIGRPSRILTAECDIKKDSVKSG